MCLKHYCFILVQLTNYISASVLLKSNTTTIIGEKLYTVFENKEYAAFYNIPYAEPPVKELRFKPPKEIMTEFNGEIYDHSTPRKINVSEMREDCLYLSVYMPVTDNKTAHYPIIVWLHEYTNDDGPDFFVDEDVLVVTVTFRTGIFGFLNTEDDFAEGNMGAKDVLIALKWLRRNIYRFNGDKERVTIIGSGNAAILVASMLVSASTDDLYTRVIIFDGSALSPADYRRHNFEIAHKLYWKLKGRFVKFDRKELYECLRNKSSNDLFLLSRNLYDSTEVRDSQRLINSFSCSVEQPSSAFMTKSPLTVYNRKFANNNVQVLLGYTSLVSLYRLKGLADNRRILKYLNYNFQYLLPFEGKSLEFDSKEYARIRQKIMNFYFLNGTISERSLRRYAKYASDQVIYPILRQALLHSETSHENVYLYRFPFKGSLNKGWSNTVPNLKWMGATSGDEICYLFRCKSLSRIYTSDEATNEKRFIKKFVRLLTNFVKTGKPTPVSNDGILGNLQWKPLRGNDNLRAMNLGRHFKMINVPEEKRLNFWDDLKNDFV